MAITYTPHLPRSNAYCLFTSGGAVRWTFSNIIFYRGDEIVAETKGGAILVVHPPKSPEHVPYITLDKPLRRRSVIDLMQGGNFWIPSGDVAVRCTVYIDLDREKFVFAEEREVLLMANIHGQTFGYVRDLTGTFMANRVETVPFLVPNKQRTVNSTYGDIVSEIRQYLANNNSEEFGYALTETLEHPKLLLLMLRAAAESKVLGDNPTVDSVLRQLIVCSQMSV